MKTCCSGCWTNPTSRPQRPVERGFLLGQMQDGVRTLEPPFRLVDHGELGVAGHVEGLLHALGVVLEVLDGGGDHAVLSFACGLGAVGLLGGSLVLGHGRLEGLDLDELLVELLLEGVALVLDVGDVELQAGDVALELLGGLVLRQRYTGECNVVGLGRGYHPPLCLHERWRLRNVEWFHITSIWIRESTTVQVSLC